MRLTWNEIRRRAVRFAQKWADRGYEKGETQLFYKEFFELFDVPVSRFATFEHHVKLIGGRKGYIDLFWKGTLLVEQKSAGRSLEKARKQAWEYLDGLTDAQLPRYILLSDFQSFELSRLKNQEEYRFKLSDLPKHVEKFSFIMGIEEKIFKDPDPVNRAAVKLVGELYDSLKKNSYPSGNLQRFLVRIVFCLFADSTGIFPTRHQFLNFLEQRTSKDGSDLGPKLIEFFQTLNQLEDERARNLDEDLASFPYINGSLFKDQLTIPSCDSNMRDNLIKACEFDWSQISPAIFGALFQSVMDKKERRNKGAHYTEEKNILKVIEPLFLDELRNELERIKKHKRGRKEALQKFHDHLAKLTFLDPACGCGNFLIVAYRELRELEIDIIRELRSFYADSEQQELDAASLSRIDVDQFYGIEVGEFPVRIAETAMWMMDHMMNNKLSLEFGESFVRIPLRKSPNIIHGDALEVDWKGVLSPDKCSFILGNPPFIGSKLQTPEQRAQVRRIASLGRSGGTLDYVTAWFIKAGEYTKETSSRIGFVATSSITQGEQVSQLWPILFDRLNLEIDFAYRPFEWESEARGKASVYVVIIGLSKEGGGSCLLTAETELCFKNSTKQYLLT